MRGQRAARWAIYLSGMVTLALGISLNAKTGLGVSPIVSIAWCVSRIWNLSFGDMTFLLYALLVAAQLVLRPRREYPDTLAQLVVSLVFSRLLNAFEAHIPYDSTTHPLPVNLALLALAILLTGAGVAMTVNMRLTLNPGDGIVQAIARRAGWSQGFAKNVFDIGCVCTTLVLGLLLTGQVLGIGLGTLLAMIGVGRAVSLVNALFQERMCRLAGLERQAPPPPEIAPSGATGKE